MGLFDKLFGSAPKPKGEYGGDFKMLNGYKPYFSSFSGGIYESELVRASIGARASHISKMSVELTGAAKPLLKTRLKNAPNSYQTWGQFLYRLSTILDIHNTAFIAPTFDEYGDITGIFPILPNKCKVVQYGNKPYLRYEFAEGKFASIELELCGIMTKHQYSNDLFGETNTALLPTMELIHMQNQGIEEGVKSSATFRFMAQVNNFSRAEDLAKERKRFTQENLKDADGGLLLFPNTYSNIQQVSSKQFVVDAEQMKIIRDNVYSYFGVNEDVLTNKAYGDAWLAFYEGAIEPFAVQLSEVLGKMLFTDLERSFGNAVIVSADRLQYLTSNEKLSVASQMLDRGIMTINEIRSLWNLSPVEGGDVRIIRGEYYNADEKTGGDAGGELQSGQEGDS